MATMTSVTSVKPKVNLCFLPVRAVVLWLILTQPKPARSITHPLREPKTGGSRKYKGESKQFDPDELKRKLEAHLAQLKIEAEQRRAKAEANQSTYHHVPKVAAADFARTATPELMGQKERNK